MKSGGVLSSVNHMKSKFQHVTPEEAVAVHHLVVGQVEVEERLMAEEVERLHFVAASFSSVLPNAPIFSCFCSLN